MSVLLGKFRIAASGSRFGSRAQPMASCFAITDQLSDQRLQFHCGEDVQGFAFDLPQKSQHPPPIDIINFF
jgi:hypothetical protein